MRGGEAGRQGDSIFPPGEATTHRFYPLRPLSAAAVARTPHPSVGESSSPYIFTNL